MVMLERHTQRIALLAEGRLSSKASRMVIAALLYIPDRVVAVIDSTKERNTTEEEIGFGGSTPIVHSLEEAFEYKPDALLIGIASMGGQLPEPWRDIVKDAIQAGLHIISGTKFKLGQDKEFAALAQQVGVTLHDLFHISNSHLIRAQGSWRKRKTATILTIGTDSNTGKMTTALMMYREMIRRDINAAFIGTGPTGILIARRGVSVEVVTSDFLSGAVEFEVDKAVNEGYDFVIIEGQSAITNCGGSSIAIGLLHGTMPDAMVLCHQPSRTSDVYGLPLPSLKASIALHENLMHVFKPAKVIGIGLNSMDLSREELRTTKMTITDETGLVALDPLRETAEPLVDAVLKYFEHYDHVSLPESASEIHDRTF